MGKGDKKTTKGKRAMGSYGITRKRKEETVMPAPKTKKEKATKETQKAGLSEIKKGRSYLYLVWLHGNKYYKSIWFKALMAAENYRQKYVENPKVSDTEAIPDPYLVPNIDEESISEFNKFFKGFKKRLQ